MTAHWWRCMLGFLWTAADFTLSAWTASVDPPSISIVRVNSSTEIKCSTLLSGPMGVHLSRGLLGNSGVVYLDLDNGRVAKTTVAAAFQERIHVAPEQQTKDGYGVTFQVSLLGSEDTDWYYCSWIYFRSNQVERRRTDGTIVVVRDTDPPEQCRKHGWDLVFLALSATALGVTIFLLTGALIIHCTRFRKDFRPARAAKPSRPTRSEPVSPQQAVQHYPYLITSATSENEFDFRGIL